MPKRTRLAKKSKGVADARLKSAIRAELKTVPIQRLNDYLKSNAQVRRSDPLLATYYELAVKEADRRKELMKKWGTAKPEVPSQLSQQLAHGGEVIKAGVSGAEGALRKLGEYEYKAVKKVTGK